MRSRRRRPVSLSNSYLTLDPIGISITDMNSSGRCSPGVTSCQACVIGGLLGIPRTRDPIRIRIGRRAKTDRGEGAPEASADASGAVVAGLSGSEHGEHVPRKGI